MVVGGGGAAITTKNNKRQSIKYFINSPFHSCEDSIPENCANANSINNYIGLVKRPTKI